MATVELTLNEGASFYEVVNASMAVANMLPTIIITGQANMYALFQDAMGHVPDEIRGLMNAWYRVSGTRYYITKLDHVSDYEISYQTETYDINVRRSGSLIKVSYVRHNVYRGDDVYEDNVPDAKATDTFSSEMWKVIHDARRM